MTRCLRRSKICGPSAPLVFNNVCQNLCCAVDAEPAAVDHEILMVENALPAGNIGFVVTVSGSIHIPHHFLCRLGIHLQVLHTVFQPCLIGGIDIHIQMIRDILQNVVRTASHNDAGSLGCEIPDDIFEKMQGKSYKVDCTLPRENLRYIHVLHVGFDNQVHEGELVVNKDIADDVLEIFKELYESGYQIEKVRLVDEYDADDESSMSDNNSSAFNFRFISHTTKISKHGMGMAVDINTLYNPYVKTVDGELSIEPANAADYVDRSRDFSHKIDHDDLCYKLFTEHGFEWGGDWTHSKDYQHFEK